RRRLREQRLRALREQGGRTGRAARSAPSAAAGGPILAAATQHPLRVQGLLGFLRPPTAVQRQGDGRGTPGVRLRHRERSSALPALHHEVDPAVVADPGEALPPLSTAPLAVRQADVHRRCEAVETAYLPSFFGAGQRSDSAKVVTAARAP